MIWKTYQAERAPAGFCGHERSPPTRCAAAELFEAWVITPGGLFATVNPSLRGGRQFFSTKAGKTPPPPWRTPRSKPSPASAKATGWPLRDEGCLGQDRRLHGRAARSRLKDDPNRHPIRNFCTWFCKLISRASGGRIYTQIFE